MIRLGKNNRKYKVNKHKQIIIQKQNDLRNFYTILSLWDKNAERTNG